MTTAEHRRAAAEDARERAATGQLTHRQILIVFSGLMLGMFLAALDQTIVLTAIRTIADDLNGLSEQAWVTTAFLITATISTPLYGKLSDLYGRKPFFITAISIFLIGSLACTVAQDMYQLAAFRAVQGLGAGGLFSLALAIIADVVPARERAKYQGYFLAVFGTSSVLGPLIGGFFAGQAEILGVDGWRWLFLVNLPIGALALTVVTKVLHLPHNRREHKIDWPGAMSIAILLVPLLIVAEQGREWGWGSDRSIICYVIGGLGLIFFLVAELRAGDDALIPLRLFRTPTFSVALGAGLLVGIGMFGVMGVIPQYLQIVKGATPTEAGFLTLPLVLGIMISSIASGQITSRTGRYKLFPIVGTGLMVVGLLLMNRLTVDTALWEADVYMFVFGLGLGMNMQTLMLAAQNAVPPKDMGVATSSGTFFRQMGGTLGTAVFLSILFSVLAGKIGDAFRQIAPTPEFRTALREAAQARAQGATGPAAEANNQILNVVQRGDSGGGSGVMQDSSFLQHADARLARPFLEGFSDSLHPVFIVGACVVGAAFLVLLFLKEIPLRNQSGIQARLADERAAAGEPEPVTTGDQVVTTEEAEPVYAMAAATNGHNGGVPNGTAPAGNAAPLAKETVTVSARRHAGDGQPEPEQPETGQPTHELAQQEQGNGQYWFSPAQDPASAGRSAASPAPAGHVPLGRLANGSSGEHGGQTITGQVRTSDGQPIGSAALTLIDLTGRQVGRATSAGDGSYRMDVPGSGSFVLIAAAGAHQPEASTVRVGDGPVQLDLLLTGTAGLSGRVFAAESGEPVPGATTTLADGRGEVVGAALTGQDGAYGFGDLLPGGYTLVVSAESFRPAALSVTIPANGPVNQDIQLSSGSKLHGVARTSNGSRPIADARITLLDAAGNVVGVTNTDDAGEYSFGDLHAGDYTVIASGYPPVASTLRVTLGRHGEHDVELGHPDA